MSNNFKSISLGILGILLILIAIRTVLTTLDTILLVVGVILLSLGATIADRDREKKKAHDRQEIMKELYGAIQDESEPAENEQIS